MEGERKEEVCERGVDDGGAALSAFPARLRSLQHHWRSPSVASASPAVLISPHVHHLKLASRRVRASVTVAPLRR